MLRRDPSPVPGGLGSQTRLFVLELIHLGGKETAMPNVRNLKMLLAGVALMASAVAASAQGSYTIGVSNTVQGNGWREEMICAIKAQALASGKVAKLNIAHRNTDA